MALMLEEVTTVDVRVERFRRIPISMLLKNLEIVSFSQNVCLTLFSAWSSRWNKQNREAHDCERCLSPSLLTDNHAAYTREIRK